MKRRDYLRKKLIDKFRSLRAASVHLRINYHRLSTIVSGWVNPRADEIQTITKALGLSAKDLEL